MKPPPVWEPQQYAPKKANNPVIWVVVGGICLCGCLCLPISGAILFPIFAQARDGARTTQCMSNMKQLGLASLMYANDNNDVLPAAGGWMDSLEGYTRSKRVFACPLLRGHGYGYAMNSNLAGKDRKSQKNPRSTILLFESNDVSRNAHSSFLDWAKPPRHNGRNNAAYLDAHVGRVFSDRLNKS